MFDSPKLKVLSLMLTVGLLAGCAGGASLTGQKVAMVNDKAITVTEFNQKFGQMLSMMNMDPNQIKGNEQFKPMEDMLKRIALQQLVLTKLVEQEAEQKKIAVTDQEVDKLYDEHMAQVGGEKAMKEQLEKMKVSEKDFKAILKEQLLKEKLVESIGANKITVKESEAWDYYNSNPKQFDTPEQVRARHILVNADRKQIEDSYTQLKKEAKPEEIKAQVEKTMAEKRKKAEELLAQAKTNPEKFETIAKEHSDDKGSAKEGGDLGYFSKEVMVPTFSKAAFETKPGQIHDTVVESPFGFHVIQVLDHKAPKSHKFEEVKDQIIAFLENQRKMDIMDSWISEKKKKAKIEIEPGYEYLKEMAQELPSTFDMTSEPKEEQAKK